jgi:NitT/TauT family transport system substrate-binding protein
MIAGCSSGRVSAAPEVEVPEVPIGVLPVPDCAPLYLAQHEGIFQRHGLRPKFVESELTGDNRFNLDSGKETIHFDSWATIFLNIADGADWLLAGEGAQVGTNSTAIFTSPKSKLRNVHDLKGNRIGVNNTRGLGTMLINALLATNGIKPDEVNYVQMQTDKIAAAVRAGQVEAGWLFEPYLTAAELETGAVPLADTSVGPTLDLPQSGYVCSRKFAHNNPLTIKAFQSALVEAAARVSDRSIIEREWSNYLQVNESVIKLMNVGAFPSSLRAVRPQRVADLMLTQGTLSKRIDVAKLLA